MIMLQARVEISSLARSAGTRYVCGWVILPFLVSTLMSGTSVRAATPAPKAIDSLFAEADFVGFVTLVVGEQRDREMGKRREASILYKARVERTLRGDSTTRYVYFGGIAGGGLNQTYLVFLQRTGMTVGERLRRLRGLGNPHFDTSSASYQLVLHGGYGMMETGYTTALYRAVDAESGSAVRIATEYVLIPEALSAVSITSHDDSLFGYKWVGGRELGEYLESLGGRSANHQSGMQRTQPPQVSHCSLAQTLYRGRTLQPTVASEAARTLRPLLRGLVTERLADAMTLERVMVVDSAQIARYYTTWQGPSTIVEVLYVGSGSELGFERVCIRLAATERGDLLSAKGSVLDNASGVIGLEQLRAIADREDLGDGDMIAELSNVTVRGTILWHVSVRDWENREKEIHLLVDAQDGQVVDAYDTYGEHIVW